MRGKQDQVASIPLKLTVGSAILVGDSRIYFKGMDGRQKVRVVVQARRRVPVFRECDNKPRWRRIVIVVPPHSCGCGGRNGSRLAYYECPVCEWKFCSCCRGEDQFGRMGCIACPECKTNLHIPDEMEWQLQKNQARRIRQKCARLERRC